MRVVIAGGSGLIGQAACAGLREAGHEPVALTRAVCERLPDGTRAVAWHPPAVGAWTQELAGAGAVINLAGETVGRWPWTARRRRILRDSRLVPTRALVDAIAALPPERRPRVLLSASGTDVYEGLDAQPADEDEASFGKSFLARLSIDWEDEALRAERLGVRVVLLRISLVVAPRASSLRLLALPFRLFAGGPVGAGRQWVSWVALRDVVGLILCALESDEVRGPLNIAAPDPRPQAEFARALGRALRRPSWLRTPAWALRLAMGDMATLALGSRRVWPAKALAMGYAFSRARLEPALEEALGRRSRGRTSGRGQPPVTHQGRASAVRRVLTPMGRVVANVVLAYVWAGAAALAMITLAHLLEPADGGAGVLESWAWGMFYLLFGLPFVLLALTFLDVGLHQARSPRRVALAISLTPGIAVALLSAAEFLSVGELSLLPVAGWLMATGLLFGLTMRLPPRTIPAAGPRAVTLR